MSLPGYAALSLRCPQAPLRVKWVVEADFHFPRPKLLSGEASLILTSVRP